MRLIDSFPGIVALSLILIGCASGSPEATRTYERAPVPPPESPPEVPEPVPLPGPTDELTLRQAMALSMAHSPHLRAFGAHIQQAEARALQAGRWYNPEIDAEIENVAGSGEFSGTDAAELTVGLAQTVPLGGDIGRRRELAESRTHLAQWDYEAARLEVLVEVTQRFVEALAAERRLVLATQELELARETERIITGRVEAGDASPVEQARVVVPVVTAELALMRAERLRKAAYRQLALTWTSKDTNIGGVVGNLDDIAPAPEPEILVEFINRNPTVARWATEISERIAERRLAKAEAMPDLTARLGVKREYRTEDAALVIGLSLPLPLFDRRQGDILAARFAETAARQRQRDAELRVERLLNTAYTELLTAHDEALALRDRALPAADRAFEATRQAFEEGNLPFLDVLDAQQTLFALQRRYLDALVAYHTATAEIESLIGQRLADLQHFSTRQGQ